MNYGWSAPVWRRLHFRVRPRAVPLRFGLQSISRSTYPDTRISPDSSRGGGCEQRRPTKVGLPPPGIVTRIAGRAAEGVHYSTLEGTNART